MKHLKIWFFVTFLLIFFAGIFFLQKYYFLPETKDIPSVFEEPAPVNKLDPTVVPQPVTGDEAGSGKVPKYVEYTSSTLIISDTDWLLDTFDEQRTGPYVIFTAYKKADIYYGIFRFNRDTHEIKTLYSQVKELGINYYSSVNQFSGAGILISPDDQKFFFIVEPNFYWKENFILMDMDGNRSKILPPDQALGINWFTKDALTFSPHNFREGDKMQIINLTTGVTSTTKLPMASGLNMFLKVSPLANAYVSQQFRQGDLFGKRYTCGAGYTNVVVYAYPSGKELYRIDNVYFASYRWLTNGTLQIRYQKIMPGDDIDNRCANVKNNPVEEIYTLPSKM